jgi:D-3-phosphoglycerate dehydrogenase
MRRGEWDRKRFRGSELHGKTLALIGAGRIGGEVARRARAFGMRVIAYDPFLREERASQLGITTVSLHEALEHGDVVSLHVPLTETTTGLIGAREIGLMKPSAVLVNAARGGVLDEAALVDALQADAIAGAALDTYTSEPLASDHPLRSLDSVLLTPHIGAATVEAQHNVAFEVADAVRAALLDDAFGGALNAPAVGSGLGRRLQPLTDLATRLGRLVCGLGTPPESVEVRYAGDDEQALRPLAAAALVGILQGIVGPESVNLVNALHLAETRGLHLRRVHLAAEDERGESVELRVSGAGRETRVMGTLRGRHPRLVRVDQFPMDVRPEGVLLLLRNLDVPGVIGRVGTLLGEARVNIAEYHQSRIQAGGDALAAIAVDERIDADLLERLSALDDVLDVRQVDLG